MHDHFENHDSPYHPPAISRRWKRATVYGNLALGAAELIIGGTNSLSLAADGIHNIGDAGTYNAQANDVLHNSPNDHLLHRRRKIVHWIIAGSSLLVSVKAGSDLMSGAQNTAETASMYAAGASLFYNGGLLVALRRGIARRHAELGPEVNCHREEDLTKHFLQLDIPSAVLAVTGVVAQKYGIDSAEQVAAITSGIVGAIAFRPTVANLNHSH